MKISFQNTVKWFYLLRGFNYFDLLRFTVSVGDEALMEPERMGIFLDGGG